MPAARASGTVPRCSQPRSLGLTSASVSASDSARWSTCRADRPGSRRRAPVAHGPNVPAAVDDRPRSDDNHPIGHVALSTIGPWRTGSAACGGCSTRRTRRGWSAGCLGQLPKHVGVMLDGNRRWAKAVGARHRPRPPGRRRQHRAAARLVRRGRHRGGHALAALDRQPQPAGRRARARCSRSSRTRRRVAGRAARWRLHPVGALDLLPVHDRREAQGRRGGDPRRRRDARQHRGRATAAVARSRTPCGPCSTSTPASGTSLEELAADHRRRAHRRPPLHQGPARPRPGDPHLGGAAAGRLPAVAERAQRVLLLRGLLARLPAGRLPARDPGVRRTRERRLREA